MGADCSDARPRSVHARSANGTSRAFSHRACIAWAVGSSASTRSVRASRVNDTCAGGTSSHRSTDSSPVPSNWPNQGSTLSSIICCFR